MENLRQFQVLQAAREVPLIHYLLSVQVLLGIPLVLVARLNQEILVLRVFQLFRGFLDLLLIRLILDLLSSLVILRALVVLGTLVTLAVQQGPYLQGRQEHRFPLEVQVVPDLLFLLVHRVVQVGLLAPGDLCRLVFLVDPQDQLNLLIRVLLFLRVILVILLILVIPIKQIW